MNHPGFRVGLEAKARCPSGEKAEGGCEKMEAETGGRQSQAEDAWSRRS